MMPSDDVVRAAITGDTDAGATIGKWLAAELSKFFANSFRDSNIIAELLQATMVRVWTELADQNPSDAHEFRQWCLDVGRRTAATTGRKARRDRERMAKLAVMHVDPPASLSSTFAAAERRKLVERCIEQLETPYREALRHKLNGGTARSFADAKGIPINTVYTRRRRARKKLEELIARESLNAPPSRQ